MVRKILNQKTFAAIFITITNLIFFANISRFDPDPHHDGVMFTAALASALGKVPNREFFAQYGPLTPVLQGMWLDLTSPTLFNLRLLHAIILTISALLMFLIISKRIRVDIAMITTLIWTFGNPLLLTAILPWATNITTFLILLIIYSYEKLVKFPRLIAFSWGLVFVLGFIVRIHFAVTAVFILIFLWKKRLRHKVILKWLFIGILSGVSITSAIFSFYGIWSDFIYQCFIWPAQFVVEVKRTWREYFSFKFIFYGFFIIGTSLFLNYLSKKNILNRAIKIIFGLLITILFVDASSAYKINNLPIGGITNDVFHNLKIIRESMIIGPLLSLPVLFGSIFIWVRKRKRIVEDDFIDFAVGVTITAFLYLYPVPDSIHLWWVAPIIISGIFLMSSSIGEFSTKLISNLKFSLMIPILIGSIMLQLNYLQIPREPYKSKTLVGMLGKPTQVQWLDATMLNLEKYAHEGGVEFRCADGIYASAGGKFLADNKIFTDLGFPNLKQTSKIEENNVFYCGTSSSVSDLEESGKLKLIFQQRIGDSEYFNLLFEKLK